MLCPLDQEQTRMPALATSIQHCTRGSIQGILAKIEKETIQIGLEDDMISYIEKSQRIPILPKRNVIKTDKCVQQD